MQPPKEYSVKIKKFDFVAENAFKLHLQKPKDFVFAPGQFIMLTANIQGEEVTRAYSLASLPDENELMLYIKVVPGGKMTGYLSSLSGEYPELKIKGPFGALTPEHIGQDLETLVFIVAGSGISPVRPLAYHYLKSLNKQVVVVHQERFSKYLVFREDFISWGAKYVPVLSREKAKGAFLGHVEDFIEHFKFPSAKYVLVGNPSFVKDVKEYLVDYEVFTEQW